jgi:hypothetical protein
MFAVPAATNRSLSWNGANRFTSRVRSVSFLSHYKAAVRYLSPNLRFRNKTRPEACENKI